MSNYIVEDDVRNYRKPTNSKKKKKKNNSYGNKLVIGIVILLIFLLFISIFNKKETGNKYADIENNLVLKAKEYVQNNGIVSNREVYFDIGKLKTSVPDNCNYLSGVIYRDGEYIPYLLCDDYESKITNNNSRITLLGGDVILLLKGDDYYDMGYKSSDQIEVSGIVNTKEEGIYNIHYISSNYVVIRKVIVVNSAISSVLMQIPMITIKNNVGAVNIGENYIENVEAVDRKDGNITNKILKVINLDSNNAGEYQNIYSVRNSLGYTKTIIHNIKVTNSNSDDETSVLVNYNDEEMINTDLDISFKIGGSNYSYTRLPDNTTTIENEFKYSVSENGRYEFTIVNNDDTEISKVINITNIDKTIPTGTCNVVMHYNKTVFNVKVTSFNYITGYNYFIDGKESGYKTTNTYTGVKANSNNLYVKAKDYIGNEGAIKCNVTAQKSSLDDNGIRVVINGKPRLHIPIAQALANKGYTVNDLNKCIYNRVVDAIPGTRYGVTAAAFGLIDCTYKMTGYVLAYNHTSGKVEGENYCKFNSDICGKLGINTRWGSSGGQCAASSNGVCWHGLNCATFVRWAMCNGGMDLCTRGSADAFDMASTKYFPEADGVLLKNGTAKNYYGRNLANNTPYTLVRMIKPGDVIATNEGGGHTFVVVGRDKDGIYTAEDGYYMRYIKYSYLAKNSYNYLLLFLDNYYINPNNRNKLYN